MLITEIERLEKDIARLIEAFSAQQGIVAEQVSVRVRITRGAKHVQIVGLEIDVPTPANRIRPRV